jgi:hypothetical protein
VAKTLLVAEGAPDINRRWRGRGTIGQAEVIVLKAKYAQGDHLVEESQHIPFAPPHSRDYLIEGGASGIRKKPDDVVSKVLIKRPFVGMIRNSGKVN